MKRDRNVRVTSRRRVFDGHLKLDELVIAYDRARGEGRTKGQRRLVLERGDSAAVLVHDVESDTILLTRQVRAPTIDKGPALLRELPAGSIEHGETAQACIARELEEEIGYRVARSALKRIATFYVSPGGSSERVWLFYARVRPRDLRDASAGGLASEGEDIETVRVKRQQFQKQALAGRIDDAKTLIAGLWLASRPAQAAR